VKGEIALADVNVNKYNVSEFERLELVNDLNMPLKEQQVLIIFMGDEY